MINKYLLKFDNYLLLRTKSEIVMILITIISLIAFIFLYILSPKMHHKYTKQNHELQTLKQLLEAKKSDFANGANLKDENAFLDKIKSLENQLHVLNQTLNFTDSWTEVLASISELAKKNNIKLQQSKNHPLNKSSCQLCPAFSLEILASGDFADILLFIQDIEQSDIALKISNLELYYDKFLRLKLNLEVWK